MTQPQRKPGTWESLRAGLTNWRIGAVTLLSFSSGLPLGLVWIAVPTWVTDELKVAMTLVGLLSLAQAPWTFKFLWAPLMDRYRIPWLGRRLGHKRAWVIVTQLALIAVTVALAAVAPRPEFWAIFGLSLVMALLGASQDIAYDGYSVEVLREGELELAAGGRIALYRVAMFAAGSLAITAAKWLTWPGVFAILGVLYVPMLVITLRAPEPEVPETARPSALGEAMWQPLVQFFRTSRALEIAAFIFAYKIADNLAGALVRPFLIDIGYDKIDVGVATGTIGLLAAVGGGALGAIATKQMGLGRALWFFGFLQAVSNVGYAIVAAVGVNRVVMYSAMTFETATQNMGSAAFMVLLLRLTDKRFSATQFALLTSVMALGRTVAGPPAGILVDLLGWQTFFWITIPFCIPGFVLLQRFVPFGSFDVRLETASRLARPVSRRGLIARGLAGGLIGAAVALPATATLRGLQGMRAKVPVPFDFGARLLELLQPHSVGSWVAASGVVVFAVFTGVVVAAIVYARSVGSTTDSGST